MKNAIKQSFHVVAVCFFLFPGFAQAAEYSNLEVRKILVSSKTTSGEPIKYLKTSRPEVTVLDIILPPGGSTGWHKHPVPVYAYVQEGTITVKLDKGNSFTFSKGDAFVEVMNTVHNGINMGDVPVRLIVFYTGEEKGPNVIREEPVKAVDNGK
ncbi:MAG: cupin domain-containing protein [Chlorobiaceae bacterium]|nr:cupin domain-containing protein [Chlorobiaceae bacterium]